MGCGEEDKIIRICQCRYLGTVDGWDTRCLMCFSYEEVYCEAEQGHGKGAALFDPLVEPDGFGEGFFRVCHMRSWGMEPKASAKSSQQMWSSLPVLFADSIKDVSKKLCSVQPSEWPTAFWKEERRLPSLIQ